MAPTAKNYCFTLNNYTDIEIEDLKTYGEESIRGGAGIRYIIFQEESGENGTKHIQGYTQFGKRVSLSYAKSKLGDRAHLEIARGTAEQNRCYCSKTETRIAGPYEWGEMIKSGKRTDIDEFLARVAEAELDEGELLEKYSDLVCRYPRFVERARQHYRSARFTQPFSATAAWQLELWSILVSPVDTRSVYWYYETVGNVGKSYFANNFNVGTSTGGSNRGYVVTGGRHADIYYGYGGQPWVFFDWARDQEESFPYRVVENFKNGYFLSTKYEVVGRRFPIPHVVVFSNFYPDKSKLSIDRFIINEL